MASKTITSNPSTGPGQVHLSLRKRLIRAVDQILDNHIGATRDAAEHDRRQHARQGIRPNLMFLTE